MNYHIVRTNDKLETIINLYNLNVNELIDLNKHISNWNNLIPGTRIKLPVISESLSEELNDIEPFIEDYYPKIDLKRFESCDGSDNNHIINKEEEKIEDETEDEIEDVEQESENIVYNKEEKQTKKSNFTNSIKLPYNYYYDPYNYYRRRKVNN